MVRMRSTAALQANMTLERARTEFQSMGLPWNNYQVDVELIGALVFELAVQRVSLKIGERQYAGVLDAAGGNIGIEINDHPHRQRFSIAHEIGHFVLHIQSHAEAGPYFCSPQDMEVSRQVTFGLHTTAAQHRQREWEANVFAASLLMPDIVIVPMFRSVEGSVRKLAKQFNVSKRAMEIRLQHLDLPFAHRP